MSLNFFLTPNGRNYGLFDSDPGREEHIPTTKFKIFGPKEFIPGWKTFLQKKNRIFNDYGTTFFTGSHNFELEAKPTDADLYQLEVLRVDPKNEEQVTAFVDTLICSLARKFNPELNQFEYDPTRAEDIYQNYEKSLSLSHNYSYLVYIRNTSEKHFIGGFALFKLTTEIQLVDVCGLTSNSNYTGKKFPWLTQACQNMYRQINHQNLPICFSSSKGKVKDLYLQAGFKIDPNRAGIEVS